MTKASVAVLAQDVAENHAPGALDKGDGTGSLGDLNQGASFEGQRLIGPKGDFSNHKGKQPWPARMHTTKTLLEEYGLRRLRLAMETLPFVAQKLIQEQQPARKEATWIKHQSCDA